MKKLILIFLFCFTVLISGIAQERFSSLNLSNNYRYSLTTTDSLMPPTGLQADVSDNDVYLTWSPPYDGPGTWFSYSDTATYTLIGLAQGGTWQMAARWDPGQLEGFDGEYVSKVEFLASSTTARYTLKIWQGQFAETLVYQQEISSTDSLSWNQINLDQPVKIDANQELWVGFQIQQDADQYPIGVDFGPAFTGFGDLVKTDTSEWYNLTSLGLDFNWNIRAFVTLSDAPYSPDREVLLTNQRNNLENGPSGYLVYRNGEQLTETPINEFQYQDLDLSNGFYTYTVTAIYDTLESEPDSVVVQIGGPKLSIVPETVMLVLQTDSLAQFEVLLKNTGDELLEWNASSQDSWLSLLQGEGEIQANDSTYISLVVDANTLLAGVYAGIVEFSTNDINDPNNFLSVNTIVTGNAKLSLSEDSLFFGDIVLGKKSTLQLFLENSGTDDLFITSISSTNENFTFDESEFFLNPGEFGIVTVSFSPSVLGNEIGSLLINSNDPSQPETEIYLEGNGTLAPPINFQATANANIVGLSWINPTGGPGNWLFYGDGNAYSAVGLSEGGNYQIASRWESNQLAEYVGEYLVKIKFYFFSGVAEYNLKIWEVDSLPVLVYSQYLGLVEDTAAWNEVFLNEPFLIDGATELLIGFEINQEANSFPAGIDAGPAVYGYGDLINIDSSGWQYLLDYGLDNNWSIQAFVSGGQGPMQMPVTKPSKQVFFDHKLAKKTVPPTNNESALKMSDFIGYNLYRNEIQLNDALLSETTYTDTINEAGTYTYTLTAVYNEGESAPAGPINVVIDSITFLLPTNWVMVESAVLHTIEIPQSILFNDANDLRPGDFIGVFFDNEGDMAMAGMVHWEVENTDLFAHGDHYLTPKKDGFIEGDKFIWKIYRAKDSTEYLAEAIYDSEMPDNSGEFVVDGNSRLLALKINALGVNNSLSNLKIVVFPNPARDFLQVSGIPENSNIQLISSDGRVIHKIKNADSNVKLDVSSLQKGIYLIVLTNNFDALTKKLVVE